MQITYKPIGTIKSPFSDLDQMPIQPSGEKSSPGYAEIFPEYADGLLDLDGFSHVFLIYHLHRNSKKELIVTPFLDSKPHGVFATRAPSRPNPIGISVVRLTAVEGNLLHFADLDVLDGTPLLDIKPYIPAFDAPENPRVGWLEDVDIDVRKMKSDDRFI
jgi:tRNA-Thr(GGU) m(6)t(6)A37 methyltransferase TsaA